MTRHRCLGLVLRSLFRMVVVNIGCFTEFFMLFKIDIVAVVKSREFLPHRIGVDCSCLVNTHSCIWKIYFPQMFYIKLFGTLDFVHLSTPPESKLATGLIQLL